MEGIMNRHHRRTLAASTVAALALAGTFATTAHATDPGPTNVVFWAIPGEFEQAPTSSTAFANGPQDFHSYGKTSALNTEPQIALECGTYYQVDKYKGTHPFGPGDTLAGGHEDAEWIIDWRFVYGGDCPPIQPDPLTGVDTERFNECTEPLDGTRTHYVYESAWTREYVLVNGEWVLGEQVDKPATTTTTVKPDASCEPEPTPVPSEEPAPPACGPEGSCGDVPEDAEPEREFDASSDGPHYVNAPVAGPAVAVTAEATYTG